MRDITDVFRATVKGIKLATKFSGQCAERAERQQSEFAVRCKAGAAHVVELQHIVNSAQNQHLRISGLRSSTEEAERVRLDHEVSRALCACQETLQTLHRLAEEPRCSQQERSHRQEVVTSLQNRLNKVEHAQKQYIRLRQQRAKLERSALSSNGLRRRRRQQQQQASGDTRTSSAAAAAADDQSASAASLRAHEMEESLTASERAQLTAENETLMHELESLGSELRVVEGRLTEVAQLQEDFTSRVLEQDATLERVSGLAVQSVENLSTGNDQLRSAMQNQASFRFWILFYLLVTSLTLWFLDWYNP